MLTEASEAMLTDHFVEVETAAHDIPATVYADLCAPYQALTPLNVPAVSSQCRVRAWRVGHMLCNDTILPPSALQLRAEHLQNFGHTVTVDRLLFGESHGISGEESYLQRPGTIEFGDQKIWTSLNSAIRSQGVTLPKEMLGYDAGDLLPEAVVTPNTQIGEILFAEWDALFRSLHGQGPALTQSTMDRFISCLKIALGVSPQCEDVRAHARKALMRQIQRYIERHLGSEDLSAGRVLREFGVSRASLYRMFEQMGGVRSYITERRAVRAVLDMWGAGSRRGAARAAAERWGFSSAPNFNRVVNRMFGGNPSGLFQSPIPAPSTPIAQDSLYMRTHRASRT
ncbi:MAG: AraC family transcriptional regulator [Pseudomonadota bacterium]